MRTLAVLLLLGTALAGRPIDTTSADASEGAARARLDAERAELDHEAVTLDRWQKQNCPGGRYAELYSLREKGGLLRRLILRRATSGQPEASSLWAYYDRQGELFYFTLYRRDAVNFVKVRAYVGGGVPYFHEFSGTEGLTSDVPSPSLLAELVHPEAWLARGVPCGDGPLW